MEASRLQKTNKTSSRSNKHVFIAPGALGKGRGPGLRSFVGSSSRDASIDTVNNSTLPTNGPIDTVNNSTLPTNAPMMPPDDTHHSTQDFESIEDIQNAEELRENDSAAIQKKRKGRGINKCKKVAKLKSGEKLEVTFYNNRATGTNHKTFSRHLGLIVRNRNICPLRVHSWKEIGESEKNHMWAAVMDKFQNKDMEIYQDVTLEHMNELWNKWRGDLHRKFIKPCENMQEALKIVPEGVDRGDWEWLVKEHFFSEKFLAASQRNSENRAKLSMPHRTGSKPFRQIIYKKGGKDGNPPSLATIFFETRKKGGQLEGESTNKKYEQILEASQSEPQLSNIELIEKCFGTQCRQHVVCYGGGVKPTDLKPSYSSRAELNAKLCETQKENQSLRSRMDGMEAELQKIKELLQQRHNISPPSSPSEGN